MLEIVFTFFEQHKDLRKRLLATGTRILIEGNTWGDKTWGMVNGVGKNWLGRILMHVREIFRCRAAIRRSKKDNGLEGINWERRLYYPKGLYREVVHIPDKEISNRTFAPIKDIQRRNRI